MLQRLSIQDEVYILALNVSELCIFLNRTRGLYGRGNQSASGFDALALLLFFQ